MVTGKPLLDVLTGKKPSRVPIWFMRQAGRCLPEYRAIRSRMNTYDMFQDSEIACHISLQPLARFDYDACIVYADILHIADALDSGLTFVRGDGPVMTRTVRGAEDLVRVRARMEQQDKIHEKISCGESLIEIQAYDRYSDC